MHGSISFGALYSGLHPYIDIFVYVCVLCVCVCVTVAIDVHWHQETKGPKAEDKLTRSAKISKQDKVHLLCVMVFSISSPFFQIPKKLKRICIHLIFLGEYPSFIRSLLSEDLLFH